VRNGRGPRRLRAVEPLESHVMMEPQAGAPLPGNDVRPNLVAVPAQDLSDGQMSFDAVDAVDVEDEVQFRISTDALSGEDDLVSEDDAERNVGAGEPSGGGTFVHVMHNFCPFRLDCGQRGQEWPPAVHPVHNPPDFFRERPFSWPSKTQVIKRCASRAQTIR